METAKRELTEETGVKDVKVNLKPTFLEKYTFEMHGIIYSKTNLYYICFVDKMTKGDNLDEIDEIRWVSFDEARKTLTHDAIIKVANELETYLTKN